MSKKYIGLTTPAEIRKVGITSVGVLASDFGMELARKKEALEVWQAFQEPLVCGKGVDHPPLVPTIQDGEVRLVCSHCGYSLREAEISPQFVAWGHRHLK